MCNCTTAKQFLTSRLSVVIERPDAWGPPIAVELQVLMLIELLLLAEGKPADHIDGMPGRYDSFLAQNLGENSLPLAHRLALTNTSTEQFAKLLRDFAVTEGVLT